MSYTCSINKPNNTAQATNLTTMRVDLGNHKNSGNITEIQASYKSKVKASERVKISSSRDAYQTLMYAYEADKIEMREEFIIILLNRANKILGWVQISEGGVSGTVADSKLIFGIALQMQASAMILSHNHPSGNLKPSDTDIKTTDKLKESGQILDIPILDHLICTPEGYTSMADEGLL